MGQKWKINVILILTCACTHILVGHFKPLLSKLTYCQIPYATLALISVLLGPPLIKKKKVWTWLILNMSAERKMMDTHYFNFPNLLKSWATFRKLLKHLNTHAVSEILVAATYAHETYLEIQRLCLSLQCGKCCWCHHYVNLSL